jgi:ribosomal protein S28E/S33
MRGRETFIVREVLGGVSVGDVVVGFE